jgi:hypothetical protein
MTCLCSTQDIFDRGIGPDVDDPIQCRVGCCAQSSCSHPPQQPVPDVPENDGDWPSHATILDFKKRVNARLSSLYAELESGTRHLTRKVARVLFMSLEHEAWHTEVGIYIIIYHLLSTLTGTIDTPSFAYTALRDRHGSAIHRRVCHPLLGVPRRGLGCYSGTQQCYCHARTYYCRAWPRRL